MTKRVEIRTEGKDAGTIPLLRSVDHELVGIDRSAGRVSGAFSNLYAQANPGASSLSGLRAVRNTLLAISAAGAAAVAAAGAAVVPAAGREKSQAQFAALLKSAAMAKQLLEDLEQTAAKTPLQMGSIEGLTRQLLAAQVPVERMTTLIQRLGDAAGGEPEKLARLGAAYSKMAVKGKASMEELNIFLEAGVPLIGALAQHFGIAESAVFAFSQQGRIAFTDVDAAIKDLTTGSGLLAGQMAAMADTASGKWSTLKDNFVLGAQQMGMGMLPPIKVAIDDILAEIQRLRESGKLEEWGKTAAVAIEAVYAALRKLAGFIAEHGKTAFMVGAGTAGGLAMVSLATKILVVRAALAALRTQAILTGGALTGLGSADAIAQLGGVARWINGISGAAGAAAGPLAGMKAAVHGIGRANVVAGLALVAATMYKIKDATLAAQEAVEKLDGATGEYTNNGFLKALADGARNVGNYYESVFSGKPMAIAGEGSVIKTAPGAERKPRLTAAQKRDRRWAERRAASKAEEEAARKAAWTPEAIEFGTAHGFDPGKDDARQILDMLAVRQRTQAVRDQAALDKGVGKDTVATGVAGRMFSSGNEFADLLRLATDAREAGGGDADLGIRIIQGRAEAEIKAVHETAAAIVKTEKDAAAKIRDQRQAGIEAAERLAKLEREAIGRRGRLYAEQVRTEATQRAEAHRQAEQKAKSEEARRRQRAEDRWEELLNPPSRREQRKTERAGRRRERAKERLVNRAIGKVQDGRAGDLSQREKRALLTRRDEILADRAGKRAKRHRKGAKGAGAQAEDVDRKLAEMGEKQLAERHAIEKRALEAIVAKAEALGGPLGTEAKPDPNVAALARDVERIASMMKQDRTD